MEAGIGILKVLIKQGQRKEILKVLDSLPEKWGKKIRTGIEKSAEPLITDAFCNNIFTKIALHAIIVGTMVEIGVPVMFEK